MSKRRKSALAVLALAAAAVFVLPASSASAGISHDAERLCEQRHRELQPDRGHHVR